MEKAGQHGGSRDTRARRLHGDRYQPAFRMDAEEVREEDAATLRGSRQEDGESKIDGNINDVKWQGGSPRACICPVLAMRRAVFAAVEHLTLPVVCHRRECALAAGNGRVVNAAVRSPKL